LNLVSNPTGAFLPSSQEQVEKRFHQILARKWDISFNNLYAFANVLLAGFSPGWRVQATWKIIS
jgi:hypothetical protein